MARVKIQITTPSNNVIKVSPGVSALSSVQLYLNELIDVNTQHGADGYVLTQQADGTFAMEAVATTLADLSDTNIPNPQGGDSLVYDANTQKWVPGGVKSVNGQEGDVVITIPSPPPTPGISGLADTNITNLQDDQIIRYDSASGKWLNEDLEALPSGGTTGQALVKASNTDYDVTWDDIAVDVQFHQRYATEAETLRSGATETVELYFFAQGDGNGLAESASSDTPTSGYDIRRKLWYAEKAQANPDTSADWTQFTAIADNTTFNNAKAALLAYLKERTGGTVPISLKMTWEEVSQTAYLLDQSYGSGAEAAYSTRQLRNAATDCMVIRRASDSTTQTIGFDGSGNIDESAIETFCTGTTCTVYQWRDQSGNGNDATAPSTGVEPTIYTGGELVKQDGKVACLWTWGKNLDMDTRLTTVKSVFLNYTGSSYTGLSFLLGDSSGAFYHGGLSNPSQILYAPLDSNQGSNRLDGTLATYGNVVRPQKRTLYSMIHVDANGVVGRLSQDRNNGNRSWDGKMQEIVLYTDDRTNERTSIESNIGDYFTQNTPLLDTYSGAAAAYSLRLLDSTYTGALINVWNGTSYADIYPNVFGELDTVALAAHCGSNNGFIRYWYDQSGNSITLDTVGTSAMPKIYDATTGVVTRGSAGNEKPSLYFDGIDDYLKTTTSIVQNPVTFTSVFSNIPYYCFIIGSKTLATFTLQARPGNTTLWLGATTLSQNVAVSPNSQQVVFSAALNSTSQKLYANGSSTINTDTVSFGGTTQEFRIGYVDSNPSGIMQGYVQEVILWSAYDDTNITTIHSDVNSYYSIY